MDTHIGLRQLLRAPHAYRTFLTTSPLRPQCSTHTRTFALLSQSRHLTIPVILQPSFWKSMVPSFFRERNSVSPRRGWNPATPYIVLGLLVGSQAIQMLWLKQERSHAMRRAEAKIGVLREVIERVQRGEDVDVEGVLGTGRAGDEGEWAEVIKGMQEEEMMFRPKKLSKKAREAAAAEEENAKAGEAAAKVVEEKVQEVENDGEIKVKVETVDGAKFY